MTHPAVREKLPHLDANSVKYSEPETALIKSVEISQDNKSPKHQEPHAPGQLLLSVKDKSKSRNDRGKVDEDKGRDDGEPKNATTSNVIVFSKIPQIQSKGPVVDIVDYGSSNYGPHQSTHWNIGGTRYPLSMASSHGLSGESEQFLQRELVSTFDKIKISREQI